MPPAPISAFDLPDHLAAKADPALIGADDRHLARITECLTETVTELAARIEELRRAPGRGGQAALERDQEIHRIGARLRTLRRFGADLCLGRTETADATEPVYVGRLGLSDGSGNRRLVDWRSPAAEPFFGATPANPMGLTSRRRLRWVHGRIIDYWDEVFTDDEFAGHAALDDRSAFIASLGSERTPRMRDVLGTIAADQDAVIRAGSNGVLVVDGGPGTGKTVVALHRAAYLLHNDPRLGPRRGGVLVIGPSRPYLDYVGDVLPDLGEDGVRTCTVRDLVAEGADATPEADAEVARLKSSVRMVEAVEAAVAVYEEPPAAALVVDTPWADLRLDARDWAEAFDAPAPGTPHNDARDEVWEALLTILLDQAADAASDASEDQLRTALLRNRELLTTFHRAWPLLAATDLVGDLWTVPAYLRRCAPWLDADDVRRLQRTDAQAWTEPDLPLLDAARRRLGDPADTRARRRREAGAASDRAVMDRVVDDLIAADDSELMLMSMLRGQDAQNSLVDHDAHPAPAPDQLAGPFAHVVVDEAQELTDAQWQMVVQRCPSRSVTVVGDRAQARRGFGESWRERLTRVGFDRIAVASLSINYRTPTEVMAEAEPVIRAALPDANVPTSIRGNGLAVVHGRVEDLPDIVRTWLAENVEGIACVIGDPVWVPSERVRSLTPETAKGLEFDLVVLVDPAAFGAGMAGAVDRYVAMTRATRQLIVLTP